MVRTIRDDYWVKQDLLTDLTLSDVDVLVSAYHILNRLGQQSAAPGNDESPLWDHEVDMAHTALGLILMRFHTRRWRVLGPWNLNRLDGLIFRRAK